ncbi:MAG: CPBP family intramembrane metalloprotease [Anaerolineaceae bacterium]|nr:CPBP family intramembrane metalloprotease [Anaerolineaceae bacterium]
MIRPEDLDPAGEIEDSLPDGNEAQDPAPADSGHERDLPQAGPDADDDILSAGVPRRNDPLFALLLLLALSIGLTALPAGQHDLRLVVLWLAMSGYSVANWLLADGERIGAETLENLAWGLTLALVLCGPMLVFGENTLGAISQRMFGGLRSSSLLALLIFVTPLAETLFFRGLLQQRFVFWLTSLMASLWSILLYLPRLDVSRFPAIGLIVSIALLMMNLLFSYVRQRNGLAAAWLCQIAVNLILIFLPFVASQGY